MLLLASGDGALERLARAGVLLLLLLLLDCGIWSRGGGDTDPVLAPRLATILFMRGLGSMKFGRCSAASAARAAAAALRAAIIRICCCATRAYNSDVE
tara:strand:+ start:60 stop:353 length:294 start_codon:yes stop_codon:yes gene_type:complete